MELERQSKETGASSSDHRAMRLPNKKIVQRRASNVQEDTYLTYLDAGEIFHDGAPQLHEPQRLARCSIPRSTARPAQQKVGKGSSVERGPTLIAKEVLDEHDPEAPAASDGEKDGAN